MSGKSGELLKDTAFEYGGKLYRIWFLFINVKFYFGKLHILIKTRNIIDIVGLTFQHGTIII